MKKYLFISTAVLLLALQTSMTFISCDDDHYTVDPTVKGKESLWKTISSEPDLSQFASLLERVYYSKSEDNATTQTYADLLSHNQTFTIWAPKNDTFDYDYWNALIESGNRKDAFEVERKLICNCITRYSHVLNGGKVEDITLFNSKTAVFDCGKKTFNGVDIVEYNIGATNGIIHVTDGTPDYLLNVYEFINENENLTKLSTFLKKYEKTEFDQNASTQGPTIDGEITWVDSITYQTNTYFYYNYLNAYINREDSNYVMVMPTDEVWDNEYDRMKTYFNYIPTYIQNVVTVAPDGSTSTETNTTRFSELELDSITDFRTNDAIARNLCFNANFQFGHTHTEMATENVCDSIESTSGIVFYDPKSAALFDHAEPVMLSNGYAYVVDHFNYRLEDTWLKKRVIEAERVYESYSDCTIETYNLNDIGDPWNYVESYDPGLKTDTLLEGRAVKIVPRRTTANPSILFRLQNTLSCKYDIIAVMVYNVVNAKPYQLRAYVNYHQGKDGKQKRVQLTPFNDEKYFYTKEPHVDDSGKLQFCDSLLLAKDYEFPVSYYGLNDAYLTLEIQSYIQSSQRAYYTNEVIIDKIILVPKENEYFVRENH